MLPKFNNLYKKLINEANEENNNQTKNENSNIKNVTISAEYIKHIKQYEFAKDPKIAKFEKIALNPKTDPETLKKLVKHPNPLVRVALGLNPNTPTEILEQLSNDKDAEIRQSVAMNENCSEELLLKLVKDSNVDVRKSVLCGFYGVFHDKRKLPKEIFQILSTDSDTNIRELLAKHIATPIEIIQQLAKDKEDSVKHFALKRLQTSKDESKNEEQQEQDKVENKSTDSN